MNNTTLLSAIESAVELSEDQLDTISGGFSDREREVITNQGGTISTRRTTKGGVETVTETVTINGKTTVYVNGQIKN
jgi:hypothetical protein